MTSREWRLLRRLRQNVGQSKSGRRRRKEAYALNNNIQENLWRVTLANLEQCATGAVVGRLLYKPLTIKYGLAALSVAKQKVSM